jgi:hypothetical protein
MTKRKANLAWLFAYLVWIGALVAALFQARAYTIENLSGDAPRADWQEFKSDTRATSGIDGPVEGPVQRKVPRPDEPPQLLLLRDYFATCLAGTFLFGSALFVMMMVALRGVFSQPRAQ